MLCFTGYIVQGGGGYWVPPPCRVWQTHRGYQTSDRGVHMCTPSLPARYGACPLCTAHSLAYRRYGRHTGMSEADYVPTVCAVQGGTGADCVCTDPTYTRLLPRTMVTCTQWIPHREGCVYIPEFPLRYAHTPACRIRHIHICTQCVFLQQGGVTVYTPLCR